MNFIKLINNIFKIYMIKKFFTKKYLDFLIKLSPILKATLLLFISIANNFLAETLGCRTQFYLENMYIKHLLILFMIYFTIDFTQGDEVVNPVVNLKRAIIVWVFFHLFTFRYSTYCYCFITFYDFIFMSNYMTYLEQIRQKNSKVK